MRAKHAKEILGDSRRASLIAGAIKDLASSVRTSRDAEIAVRAAHAALIAFEQEATEGESCKEIIMGKHSSLGPIDPQFRGVPAHGVIEEFKRAVDEVAKNPASIPIWSQIIAKYNPTLIGECEKAITWSNEMTKEWLLAGMLEGEDDAERKADNVLLELGDHAVTKSHARHISFDRCAKIGLKVTALEDDPKLQDAVLSVHHCCIHTLGSTAAFKIIENQEGIAFIQIAQNVLVNNG